MKPSKFKGWKIPLLLRDGFVVVDLAYQKPLYQLQEKVSQIFPCPPTQWHAQNVSEEDHIHFVKTITDAVAESDLVPGLVRLNAQPLIDLLGPDLDMQAVPHVRVSRPFNEADQVPWHRDTFYGNLPWEINFWFPLYPLSKGAGLSLLPGSHRIPSLNIHDREETNAFKRSVTQGSVANQIGYPYAPKSDETIDHLKLEETRLIMPKVGQAIIFFGCCVHTSQNWSDQTRVSIDLRIRNTHTPTDTKPGYYKMLTRSPIYSCTDDFLNISSQVSESRDR